MTHIQAPRHFIKKYYEDDLAERKSAESKWALNWLKYVTGKNVLSVGCGPNFFDDVQFFGKLPKKYYGIDINKNNIKFLNESNHSELIKWRKFLSRKRVQFDAQVSDISKVDEAFVNKFDCILASAVLGMLSSKKAEYTIKNLSRYLRKGGRLIDIDWTESFLTPIQLQKRREYEWYFDRGVGKNGIRSLLEKYGFRIENKGIYIVPNPTKYRWGEIYAIVARKVQ